MTRSLAFVGLAFAGALFVAVIVANAWMGDDPFITLRAIDNCVHGYGLRWNVDDRVQVYTHPLWMLVMLGAYAITHEGFYTTLAIQLVVSWFAFVYLGRRVANGAVPIVASIAVLLVSSKAFVDYSTSGLENPLTHALFVVFAVPLVTTTGRRPSLRTSLLVAALAHLNRADTALVYAPVVAYLLVRGARETSLRKTLGAVIVAALPVVAWYAFATFYYGFPLPNTAYAKLGTGGTFLHPNGIAYFANSLRWDPVTLPAIGVGIAAAAFGGGAGVAGVEVTRVRRMLAAGIVAYLAYVLRIGGDYMSGRFFALPFLASVVLVVTTPRFDRVARYAGVAAAALSLLGPRPPELALARNYVGLVIDKTFVIDERSHYGDGNTLAHPIPNRGIAHDASHASSWPTTPEVVVAGAIGLYGFESGPNRHVIDSLALGDAFLARLAPTQEGTAWGRGHMKRPLPEGYIATVESGENVIADPKLAAYYAVLDRVIAGPLFYPGRLGDIVRLNDGSLDKLVRR